MMMYRQLAGILCGGLLAVATMTPAADTAVAREVMNSKKDAVITLESTIAMKMNYQGQQAEQETKREAIAVIIDDQGLAVTALSNIDQSKQFAMYGRGEDDFSLTVKSVTYIMGNGKEVSAALVLRDPDLDLAFLRPLEAPEEPMTFIDLADSDSAEMFDDIFSLDRAGRIARRTEIGREGNVLGIIERPRKVYLPSADIVTRGTGRPVYTDEGKLLGITSLYAFPGGRNALGDEDDPFVAVIVPAEDILDVAKQAPDEVPE